MTQAYVLTEHAYARFMERAYLESVLMDQLNKSVPLGAQRGNNKELRLLPCGLVAAIERTQDVWIVTTILTQEHAVANMQANGIPAKAVTTNNRRASLAEMAEQHVRDGLSRKARNSQLREAGIDPCSDYGELYRKHYQAALSKRALTRRYYANAEE